MEKCDKCGGWISKSENSYLGGKERFCDCQDTKPDIEWRELTKKHNQAMKDAGMTGEQIELVDTIIGDEISVVEKSQRERLIEDVVEKIYKAFPETYHPKRDELINSLKDK